jgi:hypothetical protein
VTSGAVDGTTRCRRDVVNACFLTRIVTDKHGGLQGTDQQ